MKFATLWTFLWVGLSLAPLSTFAQQTTCTYTLECRVTAPSGLRMRSSPSLQGKPLMAVPRDSILMACEQKADSLQIEGIKGYWRQVEYQGQTGYMFDGFLEVIGIHQLAKEQASPDTISDTGQKPTVVTKLPEKKEARYALLTEVLNYCGDVTQIPSDFYWWGVYMAQGEEQHYQIRPVELQMVLSKYRSGNTLQFDIGTDQEESAIFLIGSDQGQNWSEVAIEDEMTRLMRQGGKLFPGQSYWLNAAGAKLLAQGKFTVGDTCANLDQYRLQAQYGGSLSDITSEIIEPGQCGLPTLYWYGDLNEDNLPELIFTLRKDGIDHFKFLRSEAGAAGMLYQTVAQWTIENCEE